MNMHTVLLLQPSKTFRHRNDKAMNMQSSISAKLKDWAGCETPGGARLQGNYVQLEPLDWECHAESLYEAVGSAENSAMWDYMAVGPFLKGADDFARTFGAIASGDNWQIMVICDRATNTALGMANYMRIREAFGSAEVGCVAFGPKLKRTRMASEAIYLMAAHLFDDLGYRRFEWKCDSTNDVSMRAAERFGFSYEGTFRQDMVIKGRNRDSAWYSILDTEWPNIKTAFQLWLHPENFDAEGRQKAKLEAFRAAL